jgi:hypothetical protein
MVCVMSGTKHEGCAVHENISTTSLTLLTPTIACPDTRADVNFDEAATEPSTIAFLGDSVWRRKCAPKVSLEMNYYSDTSYLE